MYVAANTELCAKTCRGSLYGATYGYLVDPAQVAVTLVVLVHDKLEPAGLPGLTSHLSLRPLFPLLGLQPVFLLVGLCT